MYWGFFMFEKVFFDGDQLVLDVSGVQLADVYCFLKGVGCSEPERLERFDNLLMLNSPVFWEDRFVPFYENIEDLWTALRPMPKEPAHYYLTNVSSGVMESVRVRVRYYFILRMILVELSHHSEGMKYIFFSTKESHLVKFEISFALDSKQFESLVVDEAAFAKAVVLKDSVALPDVHCSERRHVMREALLDFLKDESTRNIMFLMRGILEFYTAYENRYRVYVSKFSVNKILSEIEVGRVAFLCKVQDAVLSQQAKAFAVPGAIVAVGAILKSFDSPLELFLVFIGMLFSTWMVASLNKSVEAQVYLLGDEFKQSFRKYDDIVTGVDDVKDEISRSACALESSLKQTRAKLNSLTFVSWFALVFVSFVILCRAGVFDWLVLLWRILFQGGMPVYISVA